MGNPAHEMKEENKGGEKSEPTLNSFGRENLSYRSLFKMERSDMAMCEPS
jgi:hypothetical protein